MRRGWEVSGSIFSVSRLLNSDSGCAPPRCTVLVINRWAFSGKNLKNRSQVSPASVRRKVNAEWLVFSSVMWYCSHLVQSECSSCTCVEVLLWIFLFTWLQFVSIKRFLFHAIAIALICVYPRILFLRFPFLQFLVQLLIEVNIDNLMKNSTWMWRSHHLHLCVYLFSCYLDSRPAQTSQGL